MKAYWFRLSHQTTDRVIRIYGHDMEEACLKVGANINLYYFLSKDFVKEDDKINLADVLGYDGAKAIISNYNFSGDWERDHISLSNRLQKYYYDTVGVFNSNIQESIEMEVHKAIAKKYPNNDFIVDDNNIMYEVDSSL